MANPGSFTPQVREQPRDGDSIKVCIIGGGSFGTAVACVAASGVELHPDRFNAKVALWVRRPELAEEINSCHTNKQYWPGVLPANIVAASDLLEVASGADICIIALPADFLGSTLAQLRTILAPSCIIVSLIKSLKIEDGKVIPYVRYLGAELPGHPIAALMGPNLYKEMARGEFAEATLGVTDCESGETLCALFNTPLFHVTRVSDVEAVDICGCMKNTFTLACGFAEGLGWGGNVRAAIIRRGLLEIRSFLGEFLPASREGYLDPKDIVFEACGIGDLIQSCTVGRGRALAAEYVKHEGKRPWEELEKELMGGMKIPDLRNVQYVNGFLISKGRLDAYPLLKQTYDIAFGGADPASIVKPLGSDGVRIDSGCDDKSRSAFKIDFAGRVALVTGAASGIGRCIALCIARHGAKVLAVDRNEADLKRLEEEMPLCTPFPCDLSDVPAMRSMIAEAGRIDMLVNAAGIAVFETFGEQTLEVWDKTMDINARPVWFLTQEIGKGMAERGSGSIVNISSQSSSVVVSDKHLAYSTSKAAVDHITRMASYALAKSNVRVNAVNPTVVRTELAIKAHGEEGLKKMAAKVPLGRVCEPQDVADTVLYLLSDRASMITGVMLPIDGGFVVSRP